MCNESRHSDRLQAGVALLEGLIAILIFSLGILAIVGMQAMAVKQSSDAKFRSQASILANDLIGKMWVSDKTTMATQYQTNGAAYNTWKDQVTSSLPVPSAYPPVVAVGGDGTVTVTIQWLAPGEVTTIPHKYVTIAQIK